MKSDLCFTTSYRLKLNYKMVSLSRHKLSSLKMTDDNILDIVKLYTNPVNIVEKIVSQAVINKPTGIPEVVYELITEYLFSPPKNIVSIHYDNTYAMEGINYLIPEHILMYWFDFVFCFMACVLHKYIIMNETEYCIPHIYNDILYFKSLQNYYVNNQNNITKFNENTPLCICEKYFESIFIKGDLHYAVQYLNLYEIIYDEIEDFSKKLRYNDKEEYNMYLINFVNRTSTLQRRVQRVFQNYPIYF